MAYARNRVDQEDTVNPSGLFPQRQDFNENTRLQFQVRGCRQALDDPMLERAIEEAAENPQDAAELRRVVEVYGAQRRIRPEDVPDVAEAMRSGGDIAQVLAQRHGDRQAKYQGDPIAAEADSAMAERPRERPLQPRAELPSEAVERTIVNSGLDPQQESELRARVKMIEQDQGPAKPGLIRSLLADVRANKSRGASLSLRRLGDYR